MRKKTDHFMTTTIIETKCCPLYYHLNLVLENYADGTTKGPIPHI